MASHHLIEAHLAELRRRLPADVVDELADGLAETYEHYLVSGHPSSSAATRTLAEFGSAELITSAFVRQAPGRRAALALLITGPAVGACWGLGLVLGHAWTWAIPIPLRVGFGLTLLAAIAALLTAAASRTNYARTRIAAAGAVSMIALDLALITAVLLAAPRLSWPMAAAIPASLTRVTLAARAIPGILNR
jgi:hypothetical protein